MNYVTCTEKKSNRKLSFSCNDEEQAFILMKNLSNNSIPYSNITMRKTSPYLRGKNKIKRYNINIMPSLYRED